MGCPSSSLSLDFLNASTSLTASGLPQRFSFKTLRVLGAVVLSSSLTLNLYKVTGQFPWSSLKETDRGLSAELNVRG